MWKADFMRPVCGRCCRLPSWELYCHYSKKKSLEKNQNRINDCFHIKTHLSRIDDVSTIPLGVCYRWYIVNIIWIVASEVLQLSKKMLFKAHDRDTVLVTNGEDLANTLMVLGRIHGMTIRQCCYRLNTQMTSSQLRSPKWRWTGWGQLVRLMESMHEAPI